MVSRASGRPSAILRSSFQVVAWIGPGCLKKLHVHHGHGHFQTCGKRANDRYLMVTRLIQPLPHTIRTGLQVFTREDQSVCSVLLDRCDALGCYVVHDLFESRVIEPLWPVISVLLVKSVGFGGGMPGDTHTDELIAESIPLCKVPHDERRGWHRMDFAHPFSDERRHMQR